MYVIIASIYRTLVLASGKTLALAITHDIDSLHLAKGHF